MSRGILIGLAIVVFLLGILGFSSVFIVNEAEQALVLQFGQPRRVVSDAGLKFKMPIIQNVVYFDKRVLDYDADVEEVPTIDQKQVLIDAFARYRIVDPLLFYQSVNNEAQWQIRLASLINSSLREEIGSVTLAAVLTPERSKFIEEIARRVDEKANSFGVKVVDVRIKRVDLPPENSQAIFRRMQSQREQEARKIRAEGDKEARKIRADADKQRRIIIAEANKLAAIRRGEGEAEATRIYNEAFGQDPDFFDFYRSLQALKASLTKETTSFIGPPKGDFFRFFGNIEGRPEGWTGRE